jgi:predicted phage terminase large subunit-like protein
MAIWGIWADGRGVPQVMLANAWKERLVFPDLMTKVLHTARKFKIDTLIIEDKTAGHPVIQELQRKYTRENWNVELIPVNRASGDKTVRLTSCQPTFIAGQVWAPIPKSWAIDFVDEVSRFPRGVHDECVDLTSMGLKWLRRQGLLETEEEIRGQEDIERKAKPGKRIPLYPGTS